MSEVTITLDEHLSTTCLNEHGQSLTTHAPKIYGGLDQQFNPTDLLIASLGACILTIMGVYAGQLGVSIQGTTAHLEKTMHDKPRRIGKIRIAIRCPHEFSDKIKEQLQKAATHCPVHLSLHPEIEQEITFKWGND